MVGMRKCALSRTNRQRGQSRSIGGCLAHPGHPASCFGALWYHPKPKSPGCQKCRPGSHTPSVFLTTLDEAEVLLVLLDCIDQDTSVRATRPEAGCRLSGGCPDRVADDCLLEGILSHNWNATGSSSSWLMRSDSTALKLHARQWCCLLTSSFQGAEATLCSDTTV